MELNRLNEIINNKQIKDVYYENKPVWVQEINYNTARVGFLDGTPDRNVFIDDLYE